MGTNRISQAAWIAILAILMSKRGKATLDIKPTGTVVVLNGSTFFNCSTFNFSSDSEPIAWYHTAGNNPRSDVYEDGEIFGNYKGRFRVEKDLSKGVVNLIVQAATFEDAGTYECLDGRGIGETAHAQLIVLESVPTCTSTKNPIGPNSCNKEQENLTLACSVAYRGNNPPQLEWKMAGANDTVTQGITVERKENRITSHLTISSQHFMDGSSFICQTTKAQYNCSSDFVRIIYVISGNFTHKALIGDTVVCAANTSESCSYKWKWFKGDDILTASNNRTLIPVQSGNFRCEAECFIRNEPCMITAMFAYVEDGNATSTTGETSRTWLIVVVVITIFCIIVAIITTILFVQRARNKNLAEKTQHTDDTKESVPLQNSSTIRSNPMDEVDSGVYPECIDKTAFKAGAFLGKGLNGDIYGPGKYEDKPCACEKIMFTTNQLTPANDGGVTKKENILRNGQQWVTLNHDNLLKFYDIVQQSSAVYVVMEYAQGGFVRGALNARKEDLPMPVVKGWATQIANGMDYLHKNDIVHKSLKCARVLIMEPSTTAQATLKIASFNLNDEVNTTTPMTFKGMFAWMAPEAMLKSEYSNYSDIWSYGVIVWEILTRGIPYKGCNSADVINGICSGKLSLKIPESCPEILHDIFEECFHLKPSRRPTFGKILRQLREVD